LKIVKNIKARYGKTGSEAASAFLKKIGAKPLPGFQLRYIYFLKITVRSQGCISGLKQITLF
jgi:hypothetical protein